MKNFTRIITLCCVLLLSVFLTFALTGCSGNFREKTYEASSSITSVTLDVDYANVFIKSTTEQTKIEYQENEDFVFFIWEDNGTISLESDKHIDFLPTKKIPSITLYLQKDCAFVMEMDYGDLFVDKNVQLSAVEVSMDAGEIFADTLTVSTDDARFELDNGDVVLKNTITTVGSLEIDLDNGNIDLNNVTVALDCNLSLDNGNVLADNLTAQAVYAQVDNGEISVKNVECNQLDATLEIGDITVEKVSASRAINLRVEMGDVLAELKGESSNYKTSVDCEFGSCNISNSNSGSINLNVVVEMGVVNVTFYK